MSLEIGTRLGPYEIEAPLGTGGMGEVYKARDTRLERIVALKILPAKVAREPIALERFNREARVIASLNHPHICAIYDVGEYNGSPFLVMELLEGSTLHERLEHKGQAVELLLEWGMQLSGALEAAHARGIIHRDLKPANIIVTARGDVKVLDFGIAKLADDQAASATTMAALTDVGSALGTAAYMAPEQVRGESLDQRADLFALGVVLYEIATGRRAFSGATTGVLADAILNRAPTPAQALNPALPPAVTAILEKLLEKDRELRYRHASDVRADLKRAMREAGAPASATGRDLAAAAAQKSVAVLPFRNLSADADNAFFSDGITEDLIDALGRIGGLRVASRASAFRFRDSAQHLQEAAAALGVGCVVEGSVRRAGQRLRVSAALVDAQTGFQIWSDRYDREMADVFEIQDEIVSSLVAALAPALLGGAKEAVRRPTDNLEAYEFYLKGRHYWHQRSPTTLKLAIQSFERAIALDADYALAYAGLADSWALYRPYGWLPVEACRPQARAAVERAMALGPELAEVQFAQALHLLYFDPHWRGSEPFFKRAIELNPRWSLARAFHGVALAGMYRAEEAQAEAAVAIELDPLSPFIHGAAGMIAFAVGDVAGAETAARRALELQPDFLMGIWLAAIALDDQERLDEAEAMISQTLAMSRAPVFVAMIAKIYARQGRLEECARIEAELDERRARGEYIPRACDVIVATGRVDIEALRRALAACIAEETTWLTVRMGPGPGLEGFRRDAEVDRLLDAIYDGARPPLGV
jgi:TolB-like protein/tRNA A-37 threonylcarbamoyl transferase component Bud32/Tfp pilus assembly protein PilF